ncbi:MAG TPA: hypothetical protein VE988_23885 [Gemmataceae bacterium]|nr:hypothetical protein [Gemmataceae bacterium]
MLRLQCACGKILNINESLIGKKIKCPACAAIQVVKHSVSGGPMQDRDKRNSPAPRPQAPAAKVPSKATAPVKRQADDDDEPRPRKKPAKKSNNAPLLLIGGGVALVVVLAAAVYGAYALVSSRNSGADQAVAKAKSDPAKTEKQPAKTEPVNKKSDAQNKGDKEKTPPKKDPPLPGKPPAGWQEYSNPGLGFSAFFPEGKIIESKNELFGGIGVRANFQHFDFEVNRSCTLTVMTFQEAQKSFHAPEDFESFRKQSISSGKLLSEQTIALDGHPGVEIEVQTQPGWKMLVRIYNAAGQVFMLEARAPDGPGAAEYNRTFVESLRLVKGVIAELPRDNEGKEKEQPTPVTGPVPLELTANAPKNWKFTEAKVGVKFWVDRDYVMTDLPQELSGALLLQRDAANATKWLAPAMLRTNTDAHVFALVRWKNQGKDILDHAAFTQLQGDGWPTVSWKVKSTFPGKENWQWKALTLLTGIKKGDVVLDLKSVNWPGAAVVFVFKPQAPAKVAGEPKPPAGWQAYSNPALNFSALLPAGKIDLHEEKSPDGSVTTSLLFLDGKTGRTYGITVRALSKDLVASLGPDFFDAHKKTVVQLSKPVSNKNITLDGHPGFEMVIEVDGGARMQHQRSYYVAGVLYTLGFIASDSKENAEARKTFLQSFRLLKAAKAANGKPASLAPEKKLLAMIENLVFSFDNKLLAAHEGKKTGINPKANVCKARGRGASNGVAVLVPA